MQPQATTSCSAVLRGHQPTDRQDGTDASGVGKRFPNDQVAGAPWHWGRAGGPGDEHNPPGDTGPAANYPPAPKRPIPPVIPSRAPVMRLWAAPAPHSIDDCKFRNSILLLVSVAFCCFPLFLYCYCIECGGSWGYALPPGWTLTTLGGVVLRFAHRASLGDLFRWIRMHPDTVTTRGCRTRGGRREGRGCSVAAGSSRCRDRGGRRGN